MVEVISLYAAGLLVWVGLYIAALRLTDGRARRRLGIGVGAIAGLTVVMAVLATRSNDAISRNLDLHHNCASTLSYQVSITAIAGIGLCVHLWMVVDLICQRRWLGACAVTVAGVFFAGVMAVGWFYAVFCFTF